MEAAVEQSRGLSQTDLLPKHALNKRFSDCLEKQHHRACIHSEDSGPLQKNTDAN